MVGIPWGYIGHKSHDQPGGGYSQRRTTCPNVQADLNKIRDLFDTIPTDAGGTRDSIGQWSTVRATLIAEIAAQITIFQGTPPGGLTVDGAIDP